MLELRTLGTTDLRAGARGSVASVVAQPKRFALLCHLTLGAPGGGMVRRDSLLALFWPESDADRARNSLRQALFFLRRELGADCLLTRGNEEVGLAASCWQADVTEFRRALCAGDPEAALGWYGGDFLAGFNLAGLPEWEQWAAAERERLRAQAAGAAWTLAERALRAGAPGAAAEWARRAAGHTPGEEEPLRRLMRVLDEIGDRAAAVQAYEAFARQLAEAWELQPSRETRSLAADIRRRQAATPAAPAAVVSPDPVPPAASSVPDVPAVPEPLGSATPPVASTLVAPAPFAPAHSPASPAGPRRRASRRRVARLTATLAAVAGVMAGGLWRARTRELNAAPPAASNAVRVAVFPFVVHGAGEWTYLSEGVADLLSARLDGAGPMRSVHTRALFGALDAPGGVQRPEVARAHATRLGAALYVLGSVVVTEGRVQLRAGAYRMTGVQGLVSNGADDVLDEVVVDGAAADLPRLIDELTARLTATQLRGPGQALDREAVLTTRSLPALKAYLRGEAALRGGHFSDAVSAFGEAVAADSAFVLGWSRMATAQHFAGDGAWPATARRALALARSAAPGTRTLSPYDRRMLEGYEAEGAQRYADGERLFRAALGERPDDAEAAEMLGEMLFHGGPQRGRPAERSREAWERVLAVDSTRVNAALHLARLAAHRGDVAAVDSLTRRGLLVESDGDRALELLALRAAVLGDGVARRTVLARLARADAYRVLVVALRTAESTERFTEARLLVDVLLAPSQDPTARTWGELYTGFIEAGRGRLASARAAFDRAERLMPTAGVVQRAALAANPAFPADAAELAAAESGLVRRAGGGLPVVGWGTEAFSPKARRPEALLEMLGELAARRGDHARALALAAELDTMRATPSTPALLAAASFPTGMPPRSLADAVRAHVAWNGGPVGDAVGVAARAWHHPRAGDEVVPLGAWMTCHVRFLKAELLRRTGRPAEALDWYASVWEDLDGAMAYAAPAHRAQAELLEQLGRPREAVWHWRRFAELWADADPELQPQVAAARRRVAALGAD